MPNLVRFSLCPLLLLSLIFGGSGLTVGATAQSSTPDKQPPDQNGKGAQTAEKPDKSPPAVNPGRPTITDPAPLTAPGWLEAEFGGMQNLDRDRTFNTPLLLKLTLPNRRWQIRLATDGYLRATDRSDGLGDTYGSLQYLFTHQEKAGFDTAGRVTVKFPTARPALYGTKRFDYSGLLLASRDFTKWGLHGDFNLGIASLSRVDNPGTDTQILASTSFTFPIRGGRWQYFNELAYVSPIVGQRSQVTTMNGFAYAAHRYEVYDVAVQWSLHGDNAVFQVLFGRTFFFGRLF